MSEDELAVVNSALALGDPAVPPLGSILKFEGSLLLSHLTWEVFKVVRFNVSGRIVHVKDDTSHTKTHYRIPTPKPPTILDVPESALPFEAWERVDV